MRQKRWASRGEVRKTRGERGNEAERGNCLLAGGGQVSTVCPRRCALTQTALAMLEDHRRKSRRGIFASDRAEKWGRGRGRWMYAPATGW